MSEIAIKNITYKKQQYSLMALQLLFYHGLGALWFYKYDFADSKYV